MIRNVHHLACLLLGMAFVTCIATFKEEWAFIPLTLMVPWDKVFNYLGEGLHDHYMDQKSRRDGKYLRISEPQPFTYKEER